MEQLDDSILQISQSPWANSYWFARMLINDDKYGAIGKDTHLLEMIVSQVESIIIDQSFDESTKLSMIHQMIEGILLVRFKKAKKRRKRIVLFITDLHKMIENIKDVEVFLITVKFIIIPTNNAIQKVPNNDRKFTEIHARDHLNLYGSQGLATLINIWDDLGVNGSLSAERAIITQAFSSLINDIPYLSDLDKNIFLTAFMQEFERRLAQKRKPRAGRSVEDVTSFILRYYGIQATHEPEHFQADTEVDKLIMDKDGFHIGISCKRTLRERWKQISNDSPEVFKKFNIKQIWHIITFDEDLSNDKITSLGQQGHRFYLPDQSQQYLYFSQHVDLQRYVRPMSAFVDDIRLIQGSV